MTKNKHYEKEMNEAVDTLVDLLALSMAERHVAESAAHSAEKEKSNNS